MNYIWHDVEYDDIIEAQALARERGKKAGESYEVEFLEIMEKKGKKPSGATELNQTEFLQEYASHGKNIAHVEVDYKGNQTLKIHKKRDNIEE